MNSLRDYFRRLTGSKKGNVILIAVASLVTIGVVRSCQRSPAAVDVTGSLESFPSGERVRPSEEIKLPTPRPQPVSKTNATTAVLPAIRFAVSNAPAPSAGLVLPGRRLIPCKLVNTVDSSSLDTPIIALVTRDVFWRGRLLVPKGTEVHGRAQAHHLRDRIGSQGTWVLIWADGEEISINGLALDMDQKDDQWGLTDGSAGLRGSRERSGSAEEVKLFAATFLAGLTEPFQQRQNTLLGSQVLPTMKNAALSGTGEVLESYAERLLHTIEQESTFVRVPGGKTFYLYTLDPIHPPSNRSTTTSSPQP